MTLFKQKKKQKGFEQSTHFFIQNDI